MKKKIIALCLVIALAATAVAGATLAYFTDVTKVNTNTFTVGKVDIKLDEAPVDENGEAIEDAERVIENTYPNVYPGQTVDKDPMVTFVEASRDCYVRMIVTLSPAAQEALTKAFPKDDADNDFADYWQGDLFLLEKLVGGYDAATWVVNEDATKAGYYEFWYKEMIETPEAGKPLEPLFTTITFPTFLTNEQIEALNNFKVEIVAHAIQADGFDNQKAAWAAWAASDAADLATVPTTEAPEVTTEPIVEEPVVGED